VESRERESIGWVQREEEEGGGAAHKEKEKKLGFCFYVFG
jgi:hypothetical protein